MAAIIARGGSLLPRLLATWPSAKPGLADTARLRVPEPDGGTDLNGLRKKAKCVDEEERIRVSLAGPYGRGHEGTAYPGDGGDTNNPSASGRTRNTSARKRKSAPLRAGFDQVP